MFNPNDSVMFASHNVRTRDAEPWMVRPMRYAAAAPCGHSVVETFDGQAKVLADSDLIPA